MPPASDIRIGGMRPIGPEEGMNGVKQHLVHMMAPSDAALFELVQARKVEHAPEGKERQEGDPWELFAQCRRPDALASLC